jgi:hypothetical protein
MTSAERLRRRRCIALRVAVFFGILLALFNARESLAIVGIALAGIAIALVTYWRNCRASRDSS